MRSSKLAERLLSTERSRQMLVEANQVDLQLYEFVTQELYPTYQREHGASLEADVERYRRTQKNDFNWNRSLCRLKHHMVYKPLLYAYRKKVGRRKVDQKSSVKGRKRGVSRGHARSRASCSGLICEVDNGRGGSQRRLHRGLIA